MRFWLRALPLTLGLFLSVLSVLALSDFVRGLYIDLEFPEDILVDNSDVWPSLAIGLVCALIGFPLAMKGIERLTRQAD